MFSSILSQSGKESKLISKIRICLSMTIIVSFFYCCDLKTNEEDDESNEVMNIDPPLAKARLYADRGFMKYLAKDYQGAIADYDSAILLEPYFNSAYQTRGWAKSANKDDVGAIKDFTTAINMDTTLIINFSAGKKDNRAEGYNNRGGSYSHLKQYNEAMKDYSMAIQLDPNFGIAYYNRALTKQNLKDTRGAIQDYSKAISLGSSVENSLFYRGNLKLDLMDNIGAIDDYNRLLIMNPNFDGAAYYNRAVAKMDLGRVDDACLDLSKAGELGFEDAYEIIRKYCQH